MAVRSKNYLIIGGTRGLGKVLTNDILTQNHKVAVLGRNPRELKNCSRLRFFRTDLTQKNLIYESLKEVIQWLSNLDHVIFCQRSRETKTSSNEFSIGPDATRLILDYCHPYFNRNNQPTVVITSSVASNFVLKNTSLDYHICKASLENLTKWYAVNWGKYNIRVNAVAPGAMIKPEAQEWYDQNPEVSKKKCQLIPLQRIAKAYEIAKVIQFLCSSESSYVTGQTLIVDGGMSLIGHESISGQLK